MYHHPHTTASMLTLVDLHRVSILHLECVQKSRPRQSQRRVARRPRHRHRRREHQAGWRMQPRVTYSYEVAGKAYSSSKVSPAPKSSRPGETEPTLSRRYRCRRPSPSITCPCADPAIAVLEPGPSRYVSKNRFPRIDHPGLSSSFSYEHRQRRPPCLDGQ